MSRTVNNPATARVVYAEIHSARISRRVADIVLVNPKFNVSYWGLEHALPLFGKRVNLPVACLPLIAALTPAEHTVSIVDLATKVADGTVPLDGIDALEDDEIVARLVTVRGIGRWTAEMFLLFELERPDVWPVDDLGVRNGWRLIHEDAEMLKPRELQAEGDRFRPYRSVVALYCWHAVHVDRGEV